MRNAAAMWLTFLLTSAPALAQDGFDAWTFEPAAQDGDIRDPITVNRPGEVNQLEWYAGGILGYANSPLRLVRVSGDQETRAQTLDHVVALDIGAGFAPVDRVRIDLAAPLFMTSSDADGTAGPALGDLTLSALVVPVTLGEAGGVGIRPWITFPTGAAGRYLGSTAISAGGSANVSVTPGPWTLTGEVGVGFQGKVDAYNIQGSDRARLGLGVGRLVSESTGINVEAFMALPFGKNDRAFTDSPAELLVSARHRRENGMHLTGGAGVGLTPGVGAARFRVFIGGGFGVLDRAPDDTDMDGIVDPEDACPNEPETSNDYRDGDGCPDQLARLKVTVTWGGEPYDGPVQLMGRTSTGLEKNSEAQPWKLTGRTPTEEWMVKAVSECREGQSEVILQEGPNELVIDLVGQQSEVTFRVVDDIGDLIPDAELTFVEQAPGCGADQLQHALESGEGKVPLWHGVHTATAIAEGFGTKKVEFEVKGDEGQVVEFKLERKRAEIVDDEISILEKVHFETASAKIKTLSFALLDEVAALLVGHPEIQLVEVQGHADERGSSVYNLKLSTNRAASVRQYLVDAGVKPERLIVEGYGESKPLEEGSGEEAWAKNRRVQFLIREVANAEE